MAMKRDVLFLPAIPFYPAVTRPPTPEAVPVALPFQKG